MAWELERERERVVMYYYYAPGDSVTRTAYKYLTVSLLCFLFRDDVVEQINVGSTIPAPG